MDSDFVPLDRTFVDLSIDSKAPDFDHVELLESMGLRSGRLTWEKLLEADRILIVSEAGMGKTKECQAQQQKMWDAGEPAFFIELASLGGDLHATISPEERERFDQWLTHGSQKATFFLDSIDELKLTRTSFDLALKRFANAICGRFGSTRIVLTTRPIAFDLTTSKRRLPVVKERAVTVPETFFADVAMRMGQSGKGAEAEAASWRYVALTPLNDAQTRRLATAYRVGDIDRFMDELRARHAKDFAKRPLDLIELCSDWKEHKRIRAHRDQVSHSIDVKLRPRRDRDELTELSVGRAREGAGRLALAALLMRRLTIWHSQDNDRHDLQEVIDPIQVLSGWSDKEIRTLLERPLFGFASYGRVRFHNRSVIEFLAAERLHHLAKRGMAVGRLKSLLFSETPVGTRVLKPLLRPVTGWLAPGYPAVWSEAMAIDPSVLLTTGDPESLTSEMRAAALRGYVAAYGAGSWRGLDVPSLQIQRLASPDLAPVVRSLWSAGIENPEVRETLLELIGAGRMDACADIAYGVAIDQAASARDRLHALCALADIGHAEFPRLVNGLAAKPKRWSQYVARGAIAHLFPDKITPRQLIAIIGRLTPDSRGRSFGVESFLPTVIERASWETSDLETLRAGLTAFVEEDCVWDPQLYSVRSKWSVLSDSLRAACSLLIGRSRDDLALAESCALALEASRGDHDEMSDSALTATLSKAGPGLRREVFWARNRLLQRVRPELTDGWDRLYHVAMTTPFRLDLQVDGPWIRTDLASTALPIPQRRVMLEAIIYLERCDVDLTRLESDIALVSDSPELTEVLNEAIEKLKAPRTESESERKLRESSRRRQEKREADYESWKTLWREIAEHPELAFDEEHRKATTRNLWRVLKNFESGSPGSAWNRAFIEQVFDRDVADRVRLSLMRAWRDMAPTCKSERTPEGRNTYLVIWLMGLAGLAAEAEDPAWVQGISDAEAERAFRYALLLYTKFPAWAIQLVARFPKAFEQVVGSELSIELEEQVPHAPGSFLLQNLSHEPEQIISLLLPRVRRWLAGRLRRVSIPDRDRENMRAAVDLLTDFGDERDRKKLHAKAIKSLSNDPGKKAIEFWLPYLFWVDPEAATVILESIAHKTDPAKASSITEILPRIFGRRGSRYPVDLGSARFTPNLLSRLLLLAYRHVRPDDDTVREGSYEPDARDNAEQARNELLNAFLASKGVDAWRAKLELADAPELAHLKDRTRYLAEAQLALECDLGHFKYTDIERLETILDHAPITRPDMATLLDDRLSDLDELLLQDESPRETWSKIRDEHELRRAISGALNSSEMRRGIYTVDQEAVTADEKETDIRIRSPASNQQAVIELKVAEKRYSVPNLLFALEHQLVARYMAPENRKVGVLMITISKDRSWTVPGGKHQIKIEALISLLQARADQLVTGLGESAYLRVRMLDLRPRKALTIGQRPRHSKPR